MKYRGFREEPLLAAAKQLEGLGLRSAEIYAVLNLAGAKWRSVQVREGRGNELQEPEDGQVFHEATVSLMQSTMKESTEIARLSHSAEAERFMLLAISTTINGLFTRGPKTIRRWIRNGDASSRKIVLAFAIGSCIIVEPRAIDALTRSIVQFRYGVVLESEKDVGDSIIEIIESLGNAGYSCLNPIADAMK
jgi:hypothetical protein